MNFKNKKFWMLAATIILMIIVAILVANEVRKKELENGSSLTIQRNMMNVK